MALARISQTIFFALRLFLDIHMHELRHSAIETKARILNNVPVAYEYQIYLFKCHAIVFFDVE